MAIIQNVSIILAVIASLGAVLYKPLSLRIEVLGINRPLNKIVNTHGEDFQIIPDTLYTEDLHHHLPSGLLFGASEENPETRYKWFPPIAEFDDSRAVDRGTIVVIDPQTKTAKRLTLINFSGPFITHGIELFSPPSDPTTLLIYAINHLPNPFHTLSNSTIPSARSQLELFTHTLGTDHATHLRSIWHPLIRTPNDIYALSSQTIYVTNDHHYRSGPLRGIEDVGFDLTPWSNIIHISLSTLSTSDPSSGLTATIALPSIQNPNGLGHGKSSSEILINRAASGILELASTSTTTAPTLNLTSRIQLPSTLDNPTYYHDPYSKLTGYSSSGYVLAGLARASKFPDPSHQDPVVVWLVQPDGVDGEGEVKYVQKKIFQDDGRRISTASTAVLVGIDPEGNKGMKQAWLFVTGPMSKNVVCTKIDL